MFSTSTCGLVAMTSAQHAEGRQFDPGQVYFGVAPAGGQRRWQGQGSSTPFFPLVEHEMKETQPNCARTLLRSCVLAIARCR